MLMFAGGFQVNLQGNKQTGMGHLGTGLTLGASNVYFNPGSMGFLDKKFSSEIGGSFITSEVAFQDQSTGITERTNNPLGTPFYAYASYKLTDKLSAGFGIYTPFGSTVDWGKEWSGKNLVQDISLSAGLNIVSGSVELNRAVPTEPFDNSSVNLQGSTMAFGFNAGLYIQATEKLSLGLTYRSQVDVELKEGDATFDVNSSLANTLPNTTFDATLPLPSTLTFGIGYQINEKWLLSIEQSFVQWSAYESLDFDFANETTPDSKNARNYEDAIIIRVGAQFTASEKLDLRAGFYYDESPVQDEYFSPETPNSDNFGMTLGASFNPTERFGIDASMLYIIGKERTSSYSPDAFGGKYASRSFIPGIGINYNF